MNLNHLPIIDWELGTKLANNNQALAKEMLEMLVKNLKEDMPAIKKAYEAKDYPKLLQLIHRLHGALCYVGVPRLQIIVEHLEKNLKKISYNNLPSLMTQFEKETEVFLKHFR